MIQNYIKTALRNLSRHKLQAMLNLAGLGIGLACCLLIALYVAGELRYDRQHANADRTWRVTRTFHDPDGSENLHLSAVAPPFAGLLKQEFSEIDRITRLLQTTVSVRSGDNLFQESNFFFADSNFTRVFTVPVLRGNAEKGLAAPWQVLLSERTAKRYFGDRDPLDQSLRLNNQFEFKVAGVFRDFREGTSHFYPDALISFPSLRDSVLYGDDNLQNNFSNNAFYTYLLVNEGFDPEKMAARFPDFLDKVFPERNNPQAPKPSSWTQLHLQRLTDIHLRSHHDDEIEPGGDYAGVRMFGIIALIILLIAGINYVNLSTAFSLSRAREIGVRKSAGALRIQIAGQFLSESVLLTIGATVLAMILAAGAIPLLKQTLGIVLIPSLLSVWYIPLLLLGVALATGVLAGLYPAFFLSSFRPVEALKGNLQTGSRNVSMRKVLVVAQFCISIVLLVGTGVIYRQLNFLQHKELGLDKEHVVTMVQNRDLIPKWETFRAELLNNPNVLNACRSSRLPAGQLLDDVGGTSVQIGDTMSPLTTTLKMIAVDMDFVPTYNIPLAAGRSFSRDFATDSTQSFLLNETAARAIGWKTPGDAIGKKLVYGGREDAQVVGILKDFHFESLHSEIIPMIFFIPRQRNNLFRISIKTGTNVQAALAHIESTWKRFNPDNPFEYSFLDEDFGRLYEAEMRQGQLFTVFSGLAILIACLGLFGLATFAAHKRTKEIGIRKVLGASVTGITGLLAKDFLKLVGLAIVIASPVAWYIMRAWLADFPYRIAIGWQVFAAAGAISVCIAFFTVGFQSVKAALMNPVRSLRSE